VISKITKTFALMTLPARRDIAETQFQAAQLRAIEATLRLTADVRRQYWRAVAAQELVRFLNEARGSAELLEDRAKAAAPRRTAHSRVDQVQALTLAAALISHVRVRGWESRFPNFPYCLPYMYNESVAPRFPIRYLKAIDIIGTVAGVNHNHPTTALTGRDE
jgi:hypothetical protein